MNPSQSQEMLPVCLAKNANKVGETKIRILKFLIENGNCGLNEIATNSDLESRNALRVCLYRSRLQGLVTRDEYGGYSFNPKAAQFCSLISEEIRDSLERIGYIKTESNTTTSSPGNNTPESDNIERGSSISHVHQLHDSYMTATDELHEDIKSITDVDSLGQIEHNPVLDPMKTGPPPPGIYCSSVQIRWLPKSPSERMQLTLQEWTKKDNPSLEMREIIAYFVGIYMKHGSTIVSFNEDSDLATKFSLEVTPDFRAAWAKLTTEFRLLYVKPVRDRITGMQNAGITREFLSSLHQDWIQLQGDHE